MGNSKRFIEMERDILIFESNIYKKLGYEIKKDYIKKEEVWDITKQTTKKRN